MTRSRLNPLLILVALIAVVGLGIHATLAGDRDRDDDRVKIVTQHEGQVRIVTVDDDGVRHEEVIEIDGDRKTAYLGVNLGPVEDGDGALVEGVIDDSPAQRAGFQRGDVIVRFDGRRIDDPGDLMFRVREAEPGSDVEVEVLRDGQRETIGVELGEHQNRFFFFDGDHGDFDFNFDFDMGDLHAEMERLHEQLEDLDLDIRIPDINIPDIDIRIPNFQHHIRVHSKPKLGVQLVDTTPELREHLGGSADVGVLVGKVLADTPAAESGVQVGDLIVAIDGREVEDAGDLIRGLRSLSAETVTLEIVRDGREMSLEVYIPEVEEHDDSGHERIRFGGEPASWRHKT